MTALTQAARDYIDQMSDRLKDDLDTDLGTILGEMNDALVAGPLRSGSGNGAVAGTLISAIEYGEGVIHKTVLTLTAAEVTVGNTTGISFGGRKIYDFPEGRILVLGVVTNLAVVWTGEDIDAGGSGDMSLGTVVANDATLDSTHVDLMPSTAMTDPFVLGVGACKGALAASAQIDGTTTAKDVFVNIIVDDTDVADGASDVVKLTGTITISWINLGDY
jgi:hypothetical protein